MTPRFNLPDPAPRDGEILARATHLKINLFRDCDGDVHGEFDVGGSFGLAREGQDVADFRRQQADAMRFIRKLLREFERKPDDAAHD